MHQDKYQLSEKMTALLSKRMPKKDFVLSESSNFKSSVLNLGQMFDLIQEFFIFQYTRLLLNAVLVLFLIKFSILKVFCLSPELSPMLYLTQCLEKTNEIIQTQFQ